MSGERTGSASDVTQREFVGGQELFGRYTLIKILGRGRMGIVWLARDEELEREVALKFLPDAVVHDRSLLDELKRETRRSLELTHKNIVRIRRGRTAAAFNNLALVYALMSETEKALTLVEQLLTTPHHLGSDPQRPPISGTRRGKETVNPKKS